MSNTGKTLSSLCFQNPTRESRLHEPALMYQQLGALVLARENPRDSYIFPNDQRLSAYDRTASGQQSFSNALRSFPAPPITCVSILEQYLSSSQSIFLLYRGFPNVINATSSSLQNKPQSIFDTHQPCKWLLFKKSFTIEPPLIFSARHFLANIFSLGFPHTLLRRDLTIGFQFSHSSSNMWNRWQPFFSAISVLNMWQCLSLWPFASEWKNKPSNSMPIFKLGIEMSISYGLKTSLSCIFKPAIPHQDSKKLAISYSHLDVPFDVGWQIGHLAGSFSRAIKFQSRYALKSFPHLLQCQSNCAQYQLFLSNSMKQSSENKGITSSDIDTMLLQRFALQFRLNASRKSIPAAVASFLDQEIFFCTLGSQNQCAQPVFFLQLLLARLLFSRLCIVNSYPKCYSRDFFDFSFTDSIQNAFDTPLAASQASLLAFPSSDARQLDAPYLAKHDAQYFYFLSELFAAQARVHALKYPFSKESMSRAISFPQTAQCGNSTSLCASQYRCVEALQSSVSNGWRCHSQSATSGWWPTSHLSHPNLLLVCASRAISRKSSSWRVQFRSTFEYRSMLVCVCPILMIIYRRQFKCRHLSLQEVYALLDYRIGIQHVVIFPDNKNLKAKLLKCSSSSSISFPYVFCF